jgi:FixJ family two-component response regulator
MPNSEPTIFLVAGAPVARRALARRMQTMRLPVQVCDSGEELFEVEAGRRPGCVLLDISRPAGDLELLARLKEMGTGLPVVAIATGANVPLAVRAMKVGACDFLENSCSDEALGQAIQDAVRRSHEHQRQNGRIENIRRRLARLTPGQREVLDLLLAGYSNPQIATELELTVRAIEARRAKVMKTMRARSLAELVRLAVTAEIR